MKGNTVSMETGHCVQCIETQKPIFRLYCDDKDAGIEHEAQTFHCIYGIYTGYRTGRGIRRISADDQKVLDPEDRSVEDSINDVY